jgi:hypothetical protein
MQKEDDYRHIAHSAGVYGGSVRQGAPRREKSVAPATHGFDEFCGKACDLNIE